MTSTSRRSRRTPVLALLAVFLAPVLVACGDGDPRGGGGPVELEVTVQDWTGWSREQPEPVRSTQTVEESDEFTVDVVGGEVTITVVDIDDDEIELETSDDFAPRTDSGSNHNDLADSFTLRRGGEVAFTTPALDAGTTVTIAEPHPGG